MGRGLSKQINATGVGRIKRGVSGSVGTHRHELKDNFSSRAAIEGRLFQEKTTGAD